MLQSLLVIYLLAASADSERAALAQELKITPDKTDIDSFCFDDFQLEGYDPCKKIAMQMAV